MLLQKHPELVWGLIASLYIGNFMLLVLNLPLVGLWVKLLKIPETLLYPMILAVSTVGVYSLKHSVFDLYMMFGIGILGFMLRRYKYPLAPIVLGLVLGPMIEKELLRALVGSRGSWWVLVNRPLAAIFLAVAVLIALLPMIGRIRTILRRHRSSGEGVGPT